MGTGTDGFDSDGGIGATFPLFGPWGITADHTVENLYVSDSYHIWKYNIATTVSTPYAGNEDSCSFSTCPSSSPGDGGPAASAHFGQLTGLYLAYDGTMYVTDGGANNIRRIESAAPHVVSHVSGNGNDGYGGDGEAAASALVEFSFPSSVYVDESNNLIYIGDEHNSLVRIIIGGVDGFILTFAGGGAGSTDGTPALSFDLGRIGGITGCGICGGLLITSYTHNQVYLTDGVVVYIMLGSGNPGISLGLSALHADLDKPSGISVAFEDSGPPTQILSGLEIVGTLFFPIIYISEIGSGLVKKMVSFDSPTNYPSSAPSGEPSGKPSGGSQPSGEPTVIPSSRPAADPTGAPSVIPSSKPAANPSSAPSVMPSSKPAADPTGSPSGKPSEEPTVIPSSRPAADPTGAPSVVPSSKPAANPSSAPSVMPSPKPAADPTSAPSGKPSEEPTVIPSSRPAADPTGAPSVVPSSKPAANPSSAPSVMPSSKPVADPTSAPSGKPSGEPTVVPSSRPAADPTGAPSAAPSTGPSAEPTARPSVVPSSKPSARPSARPSAVPSSPSFAPTKAPNVNDVVEIKGGFVVETVYDNFLNNRSMSTIKAAVYNISGSAQVVKITATKLLNKKGHMQGLADTTYRFKIDMLVVYYLSYYSGWNSSYVAETKLKTMKEAVEEGTFTRVLQNLAEARNATQLLTVTCDTVTLLSTIISPDSASSSSSGDYKSHKLSDGAFAGIVVGSFMALIFFFLFLLARNLDEKNVGLPTKAVDIIV
jgi:hypothetical protein